MNCFTRESRDKVCAAREHKNRKKVSSRLLPIFMSLKLRICQMALCPLSASFPSGTYAATR